MENQPSEKTESIWQATAEFPETPVLGRDEKAEVCIVGAGIAGMSIAYELARTGTSVIVLDDNAIGAGMTCRTTAHLVNALDDRYRDLEYWHGEEGARIAAESHSAAIDRIETIVEREKIECEFERLDGYLFNPPGEGSKVLDEEYEAATRAGLPIERMPRAPIRDYDTGLALRFPKQGQFHPLKYLRGLAVAIERDGGRIFAGAHAIKIEGGDDARVETKSGFTVRAKSIVVATNTPVNDRYIIHTKQAPYTTYVIGVEVPRGSIARALFWDTAQEAGMQSSVGPTPYHYVRLENAGENEILIVGGEDHKTGQAEDFEARFSHLETWTRERFPMAREVKFRWSGQVFEPVDGMGFIGKNPGDADNVFIVTGDSGNGMTHGVIAGILISDLVLGRENSWRKLYDPARITLRAARDFAHENLNVAAQMRDHFTGGDVKSVDEIPAGSGAVIRDGLSKIAAYRDADGSLHQCSAVCPHLKCIVHWNGAENTWDCPCHGSRFDALGKVITGPASSDLQPVA